MRFADAFDALRSVTLFAAILCSTSQARSATTSAATGQEITPAIAGRLR
jgi:hypothetical protein